MCFSVHFSYDTMGDICGGVVILSVVSCMVRLSFRGGWKTGFVLTVLGEPRRGTKYFCFDIFPPLFRDPLCCGVLF